MPDILTPVERSERMRRIRSYDTGPEMVVRRFVHAMGYRYRLHSKELPGRPDLVFRSRKKVIFVHGCFWHLHESCRDGRIPKSRQDYWQPKLLRNKKRDAEHLAALETSGWTVLTVWECETKDLSVLQAKLRAFLQ